MNVGIHFCMKVCSSAKIHQENKAIDGGDGLDEFMCVCVCVCVFEYTYIYVCNIYICINIYINI